MYQYDWLSSKTRGKKGKEPNRASSRLRKKRKLTDREDATGVEYHDDEKAGTDQW